MLNIPPLITRLFWLATFVLFVAAVTVTFAFTPVEATMGPVQKVFYLHLPVAINTFLACAVSFGASVAYLWQRRQKWDDLAAAAAGVAVLLCTVVLMSGMFWGKAAWGQWWTWSPRLTFSLLLWLLYAVYLIIRPSIESAPRRALISAVYGVVAFLDVPLVWLSVRLLPDIHPTSVSLEPAMQRTLMLFFVPVTMLTFGLIAARYALSRRQAAAEAIAAARAAADEPVTLDSHWPVQMEGGAP
jgi:heme exporter protein C